MTTEWTPDLILNDQTLDDDHVDIFRRLGAAERALEADRPVLERAVGELAEKLVQHLAREERMMELLVYPERVRHRMAHELFLADFDRMRGALAMSSGSDPVIAEWITTRIPEWLRFHIRVNDVPLAHWFANKTRKPERPDGRADLMRKPGTPQHRRS